MMLSNRQEVTKIEYWYGDMMGVKENCSAFPGPWFFVVFCLLTQFGGQTVLAGGEESMQRIEGTVWYRERMLPPPGSEISVTLADVAKMDVAAEVIASRRFPATGAPPWDFVLEYDPGKLGPKGRYALQGRLEADGRLLFINTSEIPAFEQDPELPVRIMLSKVGANGSKQKAGKRPDSTLTNTYWKAVELNGKPVTLGAGGKELHMILDGEKGRARGYSGCNTYHGPYEEKDTQMKLGPMAATMMACMEGMGQEQRFLQALAKTHHLEISGEKLLFFGLENQVLLRFVAVYLK